MSVQSNKRTSARTAMPRKRVRYLLSSFLPLTRVNIFTSKDATDDHLSVVSSSADGHLKDSLEGPHMLTAAGVSDANDEVDRSPEGDAVPAAPSTIPYPVGDVASSAVVALDVVHTEPATAAEADTQSQVIAPDHDAAVLDVDSTSEGLIAAAGLGAPSAGAAVNGHHSEGGDGNDEGKQDGMEHQVSTHPLKVLVSFFGQQDLVQITTETREYFDFSLVERLNTLNAYFKAESACVTLQTFPSASVCWGTVDPGRADKSEFLMLNNQPLLVWAVAELVFPNFTRQGVTLRKPGCTVQTAAGRRFLYRPPYSKCLQ